MNTKYELDEIKIELTQECPLACIHCSTKSNRTSKTSLPLETVLRILQQAKVMGAKELAITGGEPLVYPWLEDVLAEAGRLRLQVSLYSSGVSSNSLTELSATRAARLSELGLTKIAFSVYSANEAVHDSITRYSSLGITVRAIENSLKAGLGCELHFVPLKRNFRELSGVVNLASNLGVTRLSILRFVAHGRGASIAASEGLDLEELAELATIINSERRSKGIEIRVGAPLNGLGLDHACCKAGQNVLVIDHRGRVFPCDAFKGSDYADTSYGSVLGNDLASVWVKSRYLQTVRHLHEIERTTCHSCPTGCLAQEALNAGGLDELAKHADERRSGRSNRTLIQIAARVG